MANKGGGGSYISGEGRKEEPTLGEALFDRGIKLRKKTTNNTEEGLAQARERLKKREEELNVDKQVWQEATKEEIKKNKRDAISSRMKEEQRNRGKFDPKVLAAVIEKENQEATQDKRIMEESVKAGKGVIKNFLKQKEQFSPEQEGTLVLDDDAKEIVRLEEEYKHFFELLNNAGEDKESLLMVWREWSEKFEEVNKELDDVQKGKKKGDVDALTLSHIVLKLFRDDKIESAKEFITPEGELRGKYKGVKIIKPEPVGTGRDQKKQPGKKFQPEKIDHEIFGEWRARMEQEDVLPLLTKTIVRFNEMLSRNKEYAREWIEQAHLLYNEDIDPNTERRQFTGRKFATIREHRAWALHTFLRAAEEALKEGKLIPEDLTYYKSIPAKTPSSDTPLSTPLAADTVARTPETSSADDKKDVLPYNQDNPEFNARISEWVSSLDEDKREEMRDAQWYAMLLVQKNKDKKQGSEEDFFADLQDRIGDLTSERQKIGALFWFDQKIAPTQRSSVLAPRKARSSFVPDATEPLKHISEPPGHPSPPGVDAKLPDVPMLQTSSDIADESKETREKTIWSGAAASEKAEYHVVNEDSLYFNAEGGVIGVFDGLGGHEDGDRASKIGRYILQESIEDLNSASTAAEAQGKLREIFQSMEAKLKDDFQGKSGKEMPGTTATVAKIVQEGDKYFAVVGNIGDSRAYVFRAGTQTLEQMTSDDDLLRDLANQEGSKILSSDIITIQHILSEVTSREQLTDQAEFQRAFPDLATSQGPDGFARLKTLVSGIENLLLSLFSRRNVVSKNIGNNPEPSFYQTEIASGDILLCTSDGVHDNLTNGEIQSIIQKNSGKNPNQLAQILLDRAQAVVAERTFRSKSDDMTAVILKGETSTVVHGAQPAVSGADRAAPTESENENFGIESTQTYRNLFGQYRMALDSDPARRALISGWRESVAAARTETERVIALRHILAQLDASELGSSSGGLPEDVRTGDKLYEHLHSLSPDIAAKKEINIGDEFNVRIIGTEKFKKAEIEEYGGTKIEIRFPGVKGVVSRQLEMDRVYQIRITKTNQSKEKKSGGGKHYWHEAEVIGPNMRTGDVFSAQFETPMNPGVYRTFAPDGLAVFVNGPENLDITKTHNVVIGRTADFSQPFGAKRQHKGVLEGFEEFAPPSRAAGGVPAHLEWEISPEKKAKLAADRELFIQMFPEGIVTRGIFERDNETGEAQLLPKGNLDAEACKFLLQNFFQLPDYYIAKTQYVRPGEYKPNALNVDTGFETTGFQVKWFDKDELAEKGLTTPEVPGQNEKDKGGAHVVIVQDHGPDANRTMSAFKLLYDAIIDRYGEDAIPPVDREPMKNFVRFVTHIDNFTAPTADFDWKKAWNESDKIPFTLALAKQNFLDIGKLYQFFKEHPFEDAFKRPSEWSVGGVPRYTDGNFNFRVEANALGRYGFDAMGRVRKDGRQEPVMTEQYKLIEKGNRYFEYLEHNEPEFIVESSLYGKILVVLDGDHVPGRLSSAMAHGIDGMLEWRPGAQSFWFNVAPQKNPADFGTPQIPQQLAEETGGVWVRGSIVMQPDWKQEDIKEGLNLATFLIKIGVSSVALQGRLLSRVANEIMFASGTKKAKPWETLPAGADFLALKAELKKEVSETGNLSVSSADPNQKTVNGEKEEFFLHNLKRPEKFENYPINIWVMAVHEWFNDQIMNVFITWLDGYVEVASVDSAAGTITETNDRVSNKEQFVELFEALPQAYSRASRGLWKGAVEKWFDAHIESGATGVLGASLEPTSRALDPFFTITPEIVSATPEPARPSTTPASAAPDTTPASVPGTTRSTVPPPPFTPARVSARRMPDTAPAGPTTLPESTPATPAPAIPERTSVPTPAEAAVSATLEAEAQSAQAQEDARVADAQAELLRVTDRLARARAAKEQYEGIVKGFAGFITGKGSQAGAEYDAALHEYQETMDRLVGSVLEEGLKWRTRLVEKMIEAKLATPEKKGLGEKAIEAWKALGEVSLYNYIDKKGGWKDKRGFVWSTLKILSKAANLRTATALSLFGGGWVAGATAVGWGAAGAGASLSALGSGVGFYEWTRHGYEVGRASGTGARAQVFKDQAEAQAHYQAEYASAGRFKKLWRGLSGQGFNAEGAAAKAMWLEKLGKGNVTDRRIAIADRLFAFEADAMLSSKKDLLNDASYQKLVEAYKEAVVEEERVVGNALGGYFEAQGEGFVKGLDFTIGGEKSALRRRKVFSAFAGATLGLASLANFDTRSFVRGLGSEGKPPVGIVPAEHAPVENAPAPRVSSAQVEETPQTPSAPPVETVSRAPSAPSVGEPPMPRTEETAPRVPTAPPVEIPRGTAHSPFAELIHGAQGERAWTGVHKVAGGEYAHIVPQKGHRAVIQAVKELLHADPKKFGMGAHPSDALVEAKATAIARKLGFMGKGYSLGFKFDAEHPVGLFAKDGQISVVAENEETLHRLMGAVKRGGGVMKPDVARPYVENAFPRIRAHAIFVEGQSGAPVDATQMRVSAGVGRHVAPRAEDLGAGRGTGASLHAGALRGAGVPASESLTAGEIAPQAGAAVGRGARGLGETAPGARIGGSGAPGDTRVGAGGTVSGGGDLGGGGGASRDGGGASSTDMAPAVEARPVFVRVIDGVKFEASGAYKPDDLARIKELTSELARQKTAVETKLVFLQKSEAGKKLVDIFKPKTVAFKDLLETFRHKILEGKTNVRELEGLVNDSPYKEAAVPAVEVSGSAVGFPAGADVGSRLSGAPAVEEGILKIANISHRIVSDAKNHILSVWNGKTQAAVQLDLPSAFEVTSRYVPLLGDSEAVSIVTPGGQKFKGFIKFVEGAARVIFKEGGKKNDLLWREFIEKY